MKVKLFPVQTYPICPCTFLINGKPYHNLRISYQPLYQVTNQIRLNSDGNKLQSVLMVLSEQITYVPIQQTKQIINDANKYLGVKLQIELRDVVTGMLSSNDAKQVIDHFDPSILSLALRLVYEQVDADHADQLSNSAITYVESSKKHPQQKKIYKSHIESIKKSGGKKKPRYVEKIEKPEQQEVKVGSIKETKPAQHIRKQQKYYVPPDHKSQEKKEDNKPAEDPRVRYGINGNTTFGWRERLRPARYVAINVQSI